MKAQIQAVGLVNVGGRLGVHQEGGIDSAARKIDAVEDFLAVLGQRKGLGIATGSPLYVIQIKGDTGQVVVGKQDELYSRTLRTHRVNLIALENLTEPMRVAVRIRHRHQAASALIERAGDDEILVSFDESQRAITPGQAAVFYDGDVVIGGGWIA